MNHRSVSYTLSRLQRDMLIEHIDGGIVAVDVTRLNTRDALVDRGLLVHIERGSRPLRTRLSEDGRAVVAAILADYAETLIRAGYDGWRKPESKAEIAA